MAARRALLSSFLPPSSNFRSTPPAWNTARCGSISVAEENEAVRSKRFIGGSNGWMLASTRSLSIRGRLAFPFLPLALVMICDACR